jgi:DNA-binding HxlR family transcriptional regulator
MTESTWKVVMDGDGVTIVGDQFQLTSNGSDPGRLDVVVSELQSVTRSTYGQYCGLSRAIEMVGERWGLLIVRDLLVSPKNTTELHRGLPRIPLALLSMRLREMTYSGVIQTVEPADASADGAEDVYELTEYGRALEDAVLAMGRWGAMALAMPRPEDIVTESSLVVALRATFVPESAQGLTVSYELHVGDLVVHATVVEGRLDVNTGSLPDADALVEVGALFKSLLTREVSVSDALAGGQVTVKGDPALLETFVELFQWPNLPAPATLRA